MWAHPKKGKTDPWVGVGLITGWHYQDSNLDSTLTGLENMLKEGYIFYYKKEEDI